MKLAAALAALSTLLPLLPAGAQAPAKPSLIVAISVDQLSTELFREYRPRFTGGLKRLAGGIVYANGYQAHASTETCPGHSTILTGTHPARNGIVANQWVDQRAPRADKDVYCAEDEAVPGSTSDAYTVSEAHLKVQTLGDRMKAADREARMVAVAGKDRAAVMMAGRSADQRWWWSKGQFVTDPKALPAPVAAQVNASIAAALAQARPAMEVPAVCTPKDRAIPIGAGQAVGTHRFERKAGDVTAFLRSPEGDAATLAMAAALMQQMQLGKGNHTDLLAIGLSATDYVGHRYGSGGLEMCLQLLTLDQDLERFFELLDGSGIRYTVVLTADHGALDLPERARLNGVADAARLDAALTTPAIGSAIAKRLGIPEPVFSGDWYLAPSVPEARRAEVLALAKGLLAARPDQVHSTYTRAEIEALSVPASPPEGWTIAQRFRASYDPLRSADLFVAYGPNITPIPDPTRGYVATHGSPHDHDRKVPILFWWPGAPSEDRPASALTVDIMPTLAGLIGLSIPAGDVDGRCLDILPGAPSNCSAR